MWGRVWWMRCWSILHPFPQTFCTGTRIWGRSRYCGSERALTTEEYALWKDRSLRWMGRCAIIQTSWSRGWFGWVALQADGRHLHRWGWWRMGAAGEWAAGVSTGGGCGPRAQPRELENGGGEFGGALRLS